MSVALRVRRAGGFTCEGGSDLAEVSRGRGTGEGNGQSAGKGRTLSGSEDSVVLVLVAVIAAIPRMWARSGRGR